MQSTRLAFGALLTFGALLAGAAQARPAHPRDAGPPHGRAGRMAIRPVDDFPAHRSPPPLTRTVIRAYLPRVTTLPIYNEPPPLR